MADVDITMLNNAMHHVTKKLRVMLSLLEQLQYSQDNVVYIAEARGL